ncbi:unnamed protein product [Allacma fusca]|uniref:C2H2-type domain-containing protein n=1 Tax=Allacma fusca TaxID=39272 RepID=A0A8J2L5E7_9HEXA|nr:unnamed protein product [Allacma fusca]
MIHHCHICRLSFKHEPIFKRHLSLHMKDTKTPENPKASVFLKPKQMRNTTQELHCLKSSKSFSHFDGLHKNCWQCCRNRSKFSDYCKVYTDGSPRVCNLERKLCPPPVIMSKEDLLKQSYYNHFYATHNQYAPREVGITKSLLRNSENNFSGRSAYGGRDSHLDFFQVTVKQPALNFEMENDVKIVNAKLGFISGF